MSDKKQLASIIPFFLSLNEVMQMTGKARSTLWRDINAGLFPVPRKIGRRRIAFLHSEITEWAHSCPQIQINTDKEAK